MQFVSPKTYRLQSINDSTKPDPFLMGPLPYQFPVKSKLGNSGLERIQENFSLTKDSLKPSSEIELELKACYDYESDDRGCDSNFVNEDVTQIFFEYAVLCNHKYS